MSRYIDADKLPRHNLDEWGDCVFGSTIDEAPSIDIVRCKECRHNTTLDDGRIICGWYREYVKPDDFCSYGERKSDE